MQDRDRIKEGAAPYEIEGIVGINPMQIIIALEWMVVLKKQKPVTWFDLWFRWAEWITGKHF